MASSADSSRRSKTSAEVGNRVGNTVMRKEKGFTIMCKALKLFGVPKRIRTPVAGVKGVERQTGAKPRRAN